MTPNRYPGTCAVCGAPVPSGTGVLARTGRRTAVFCAAHRLGQLPGPRGPRTVDGVRLGPPPKVRYLLEHLGACGGVLESLTVFDVNAHEAARSFARSRGLGEVLFDVREDRLVAMGVGFAIVVYTPPAGAP